MKFDVLIKTKMLEKVFSFPSSFQMLYLSVATTIVGILTFMSMINFMERFYYLIARIVIFTSKGLVVIYILANPLLHDLKFISDDR